MAVKNMVQAIIDILKADAGLAEPGTIKKYYFGEPKSMPVKYPVIYAQFTGRSPLGIADSDRFLYDFVFEVGIITRAIAEDVAEKDAYDKIELIETKLRASPSLNGTAIDSELSAWPIESIRAEAGEFAITKMVIRPSYKQWESA